VDTTFVVLDKPAGIPSVALRYTQTDTVANFLTAHFPETAQAGPRPLEAGLVHRLDTDTSGLLLAARTPDAYVALREQFGTRSVRKTYLAIVVGRLPIRGQVTFRLAPAGLGRRSMRVVATEQGQEALTRYTPIEILPAHTLVRLTIPTGVRHQIRVHLAALGYPLVGDVLYGSTQGQGPQRLCLHAERLSFHHPITGQEMQFTSPLPRDFSTILQHLQKLNVNSEPKG
jgi:23S rRNA pseudouridine1911/1915/1917 synthase